MSVLGSLLKDVISLRKRYTNNRDDIASDPVRTLLDSGFIALNSGNLWEAHDLCEKAEAIGRDHEEVQRLRFEIEFIQSLNTVEERFPGPKYLDWLVWFHQFLMPATYLEIGVETGQSLTFARAPTRAVGVDPAIQIIHSQTNWVKLFKLTSDDFFLTQNVPQVFGYASISMAFIDGLHTFDQALKDFINIERHSNADTVVLIHDIFPVIPKSALRERVTRFWVGDTWKVMWILHKYRPDLNIVTLPTGPSGLGVVTNLNKNSEILQNDLSQIIQEAMALDFSTFTNEMKVFLNIVSNDTDSMAQVLAEKKASSKQLASDRI